MKRIIWTALVLVFFTWLSATSSQVEFVATIDSIEFDAATDVAVLGFSLPGDFTLTVRVTADTDIRSEDDTPISLPEFVDEVEPGTTAVKVEGAFTTEGILAEKLRIVEDDNKFEIRGVLEDVNSEDGAITVQGIPLEVSPDAEIKDGEGNLLTLEELAALLSESETDVLVKVEGFIEGGAFVATEVKVKIGDEPLIRLTFQGIVVGLDEMTLSVLIEGLEDPVSVQITEQTEIKGDLNIGVLVLVIGKLDSDLNTVATKIIVKHLLQLAPRKLKMHTDETRRVEVILRNPLNVDVTLALESPEPDIAHAVTDTVTIPAGEKTGFFEVTSGSSVGETALTVHIPEELGGFSLELEVEIKERGREGELEVRWTPDEIRMGTNQIRRVLLKLNQPAPEDLEVALEIKEAEPEGVVTIVGEDTVTIEKGSRSVLVEIASGSSAGAAEIQASLPDTVGGDEDELEVDVRERVEGEDE